MNLYYLSTLSALATLLTLNASSYAVFSMAENFVKEPLLTIKKTPPLFSDEQKTAVESSQENVY